MARLNMGLNSGLISRQAANASPFLNDLLSASDHVSQSPYAIAIAALVPGPQRDSCIHWLLENSGTTARRQASLSWQADYICTYAAALAFAKANCVDLTHQLFDKLQAVTESDEATETLTFGGLIAALDRYALDEIGWTPTHPDHVRTVIQKETVKWQKVLQWPDMFTPPISIAGYAAECMYGADIDLPRFVKAFMVENGSIASSPSASAMTWLTLTARGLCIPPALEAYVHGLDPYQRTVGDFDQASHFITGWALMYTGSQAHGEAVAVHPQVIALRQALQNSPLICSAGDTTIPGELDTGAVAMIGLNTPMAEREAMIEAISPLMFDGTRYRTFLFERNASITTNLHLLAAWPDNPRRDLILDWLAAEVGAAQWSCKWHVSPYYVAGEAARLLVKIPHPTAQALAGQAAEFILNSQRADGGWGVVDSTTEETAFAVLALRAWAVATDQAGRIYESCVRARDILEAEPDYTPLWIGKSLYCVRPIVRVVQAMALEVAAG